MENSHASLCFLISLLAFHSFLPASMAQLSPSETRILFQLRQLLEYPEVLRGWTKWTNFCYLPPSPSLAIVCSDNHVAELTVAGNRTSPSHIPKIAFGNWVSSRQTLSARFSIDTFFTVLTRLSSLKKLSLVSLGIWGPLPAKINRLRSLEMLNLSSNFIYGKIPTSIATFKDLRTLVLADNLFNGSVPDLGGLQVLQELDLGNNHLGPEFPSLGSNTNLVSIILKNNSLRSNIPSEIKFFDLLHTLDVSSNKLIGPIPSFLFSLSTIQDLNLADNQFTGELSPNVTCNSELSFVDISRNLLIGKLPACVGLNSTNRTVLSSWNCLGSGGSRFQHSYSFCHKEALAVKPPARDRRRQSSVKFGLILGIVGGVVVAAGAAGVLIFVILKKTERNKGNDFKCESVFEKTYVRGSPAIDGRYVPRSVRLPALGLPPYHVFTLEEIEDATNNFDPSNLVGDGSHGQLYKGFLGDGSMALVKCLKLKQKHSHQSMQQQMEVISKLRHRHLVSVLGHCAVTCQDHPPAAATTIFIVLEHLPNGCLRDHLTDWRKREYLKWPQRMGITIGIARGIQFLHTGIVPGVFGNDLKIDNILLDDSLTARISSYNIPLPSKVGSESPLHGQDALNRPGSTESPEKNDIYQLGVILLEIITGKPIASESELNEVKFQLEITMSESPSTLREAVDPSIRGTFAYDSLKTALEIAMKCLDKDPSSRPTIDDVLWHLQYSIQVQEGWTSSTGNLSTKL